MLHCDKNTHAFCRSKINSDTCVCVCVCVCVCERELLVSAVLQSLMMMSLRRSINLFAGGNEIFADITALSVVLTVQIQSVRRTCRSNTANIWSCPDRVCDVQTQQQVPAGLTELQASDTGLRIGLRLKQMVS